MTKKLPAETSWRFDNKNWNVRIIPATNEQIELYGWIDDDVLFISEEIPVELLPNFYLFVYHNFKSNLGKHNRTRLAVLEELQSIATEKLDSYINLRRRILVNYLDKARIQKKPISNIQEIRDQLKLLDEI